MESQLSYTRTSSKALVLDLIISFLICVILLSLNMKEFIDQKYYLLPLYSAILTFILSIGLVYKDRNSNQIDKILSSIIISFICIFSFILILMSITDPTKLPGTIVMKFPLTSIAIMFLPRKKLIVIEKRKKDKKLDPKKRITDDIYYY